MEAIVRMLGNRTNWCRLFFSWIATTPGRMLSHLGKRQPDLPFIVAAPPQKQHATTVVHLGNVPYYARPRVEAQIPQVGGNGVPPGQFFAATVMHLPLSEALDSRTIDSMFRRFLREDDVLTKSFTQDAHLIVSLDDEGWKWREAFKNQAVLKKRVKASPGLSDYLQSHQLELHLVSKLSVPEGPYFLHGQDLHQAWRLFPDTLGAFTTTIVPDDAQLGRFVSLANVSFTGSDTAVAVPSRLYFANDENLPLNGQRVAVKDNMHVAGIVTSLGSKSYARLYGFQTENADIVQLLVNQGAVVVGKTKLSAFAGSEVPPNQCIDYFPPWNVRGDGYQGPSGSSSGAAASIGGYDWLDLSIGTDTSGSARFPATSHGVWGLKVTWNAISAKGLVPSCALYDSFGLFARHTSAVQKLLTAAGFCPAPNTLPTKLLFPEEWFPVGNEAQQEMLDTFIEATETHLGLRMTRISLEEEWKHTGPEDLRHRTLADICKSGQRLYGYDEYHNFDSFRADYKDTFDELPYVSPSHTSRWNTWKNTTKEERDASNADVLAVRSWWQKSLFGGPGNPETIMIVPHGRAGSNYRDEAAAPGSPPGNSKLNPILSTTMAGLPQVLVPIGQNPYESRVSGRIEYAPIFATLVGAPGTDAALIKLAQDTLDQAGWPSEVLTGRFMFTVGDNVRHSVREPAKL